MIWLLRMARWLRHPPSPQRVRLVLIVIAICLAVVALEKIFGFPEGLVPNRLPHR